MGALAAAKAAVLVVLGAAFGWLVSAAYVSVVTVPAAREAARFEAQLAHDADRRRAEAEAAKARDAAQASIDAIEADYLRRDAERGARISTLERALQEAADAPDLLPADGACRVLVPGRVSVELDRAGRPAPRQDPAKPDHAVPAGR